MLADIEAVEDDDGLTVCAIEFDRDVFACILCGQFEDAPVPTDTGLGILAAKRIEALALQARVILEGQFDRPVMGQIDAAPVCLNKGGGTGRHKASGLLEVPCVGTAVAEVFVRIVGVAEMEAPPEIEQEAFAVGTGCGRGQTGRHTQRPRNFRGGAHCGINGCESVGRNSDSRRQQARLQDIAA